MNIKLLLEVKESLQYKLSEIERQINNASDGFIYHVLLRSYGSLTWYEYTNPYPIQELVDGCRGGDEGLVNVYTNNPADLYDVIQCWGAMTVYTLDKLPEERREISRSEGFTNMIIQPYLNDSDEEE
tara:strand:+ start:445 stop:825 length:381 start_codon:yes stop_codon:yes gene_type:complete